jgi:hypothetical protein
MNGESMSNDMLDKYEIYKVVDTLIGKIEPSCDQKENELAYERQYCAEYIINRYLDTLVVMANEKDVICRAKSGRRAYKYLRDVRDWIDGWLKDIDNIPDEDYCWRDGDSINECEIYQEAKRNENHKCSKLAEEN